MGVLEPGRTLVVEVGQGTLLELGLGGALGVEPVAEQFVEPGDQRRTLIRMPWALES